MTSPDAFDFCGGLKPGGQTTFSADSDHKCRGAVDGGNLGSPSARRWEDFFALSVCFDAFPKEHTPRPLQ